MGTEEWGAVFRSFRRKALVKENYALGEALLREKGSPYEAGVELRRTSSVHRNDKRISDISWPLWLNCGALTDGIDSRNGNDQEHVIEVGSEMGRVAKGRFPISSDEGAGNRHLDRWEYQE